ncbi:MAG: toxin-antitoxin system YwqK family antitoxin [Bradymonadaceae bacterium]
MKTITTFWTFLLALTIAIPAAVTLHVSEVDAQQRRTTTTTTTTTTTSKSGRTNRRAAPRQRTTHRTERHVTRHSTPTVQTRTYIRYTRGPTHVRHRYYRPRGHVHTHTRHIHHHHHHPPQREVIVVEVERQTLPPLSCPVRTESNQTEFEQWCATSRGTMHGPFLRWYDNGHIAVEGAYAYGQKDGIWTEWHANGEPRVEGEYVDGERAGTWIHWNRHGEEVSITHYGG